jgi:serine protease
MFGFILRETTMRWFRIALIGLTGTGLLPALADYAHAQGNPSQPFVPGELIIGYKSPQDREDAIREMRQTKEKLRVRGEIPNDMQTNKVGETALRVRIDFPNAIKRSTRDSPTSELLLLQETAKQLKENDPRVKYAHPNWIMRIDPPLPPGPNDAKIHLQKLDVGVEEAAPRSATAPDDPYYGLQWHYQPPPMGMNAVGAWKISKGSKDIVVAVLDTGILFNQEDINGSGNVLPGYDFVSQNFCTNEVTKRHPRATDPGDACPVGGQASWHGTHVAGTIGAVGSNNHIGVAGVAWNVTVLPVRVLGPKGGSTTDIVDAMRWAAGLPVAGVPKNEHPADIISMSLGGPIRTEAGLLECTEDIYGEYVDAIKEVRKAGAVVVAAAGNGEWIDADNHACTPDGKNAQCKHVQDDVKNSAPAGCPGVISVSASDAQGRLTWYSNFGAVTIMAPGGDTSQSADFVLGGKKTPLALGVWSSFNDGYHALNGTSQATPHVSGALALALAVHPEWRHNPDLIEQKLRASAVTPPPGACPRGKPCGSGQLDAARLLGARSATGD